MFKISLKFNPSGDQPKAIKEILTNIKEKNIFSNVLLGATGTGKTFTIANIIKELKLPTLILAHNKTLAGQLYSEYKSLFPESKIEYFVSNFDFYQPEAYLPRTDTYIDKSCKVNAEIEMLRLSTLNSLCTSKDVIVIASVACIYGAYDPEEYIKSFVKVEVNQEFKRLEFFRKLVDLGYERSINAVNPGNFASKGDFLEVVPGWTDEYLVKIIFFGDIVESIFLVELLNKSVLKKINHFTFSSAKDYITSKEKTEAACINILKELKERKEWFLKNNKLIEADKIEKRTLYDVEQLRETNFCNGIENYSRHLEFRAPNTPPYTLIDYFNRTDWLLVVDESHITIPQVKGMYATDYSRKKSLVDYGYRLPSALDNRPLKFDEFNSKIKKVIYLSATPSEYEIAKSNHHVVEQIIRPTGLLDPEIFIRKKENQLNDLILEIKKRKAKNERVFVITLTIKMSEKLTVYFQENDIKAAYIHNELKTIERLKILINLRKGIFDCVVGINLLREGLDLPEISLVAILDADKEGFLRDYRSLVQLIGRAARNVEGKVIMYADTITKSMRKAIDETNRRRNTQIEYNKKYQIKPKTIIKPIIDEFKDESEYDDLLKDKKISLKNKEKIKKDLTKKMKNAAKNLNFEEAIRIRNILIELDAN
ncbi:excinuclease ABC subunit UvrB [symbiont of Argiope bruennichi]|uniref:excinuclease ABC subunit UvrB n=1 Tax=symbiont of Argiope bruennichi TaxID=2810479 RepID=UPI003DA58F1C